MNKTERIKQGGSPIIGYNIRRLREQKRLRNSGLVAKLQLEGIPISTSTLSKIEQGACNPATEQLIALRKNIGMRLQRFLPAMLNNTLPWFPVMPVTFKPFLSLPIRFS